MSFINHSDKIFVSGHNGMVGSAICHALEKKGYEKIIKVPRKDLDLRNQNEVEKWFFKNKPSVVVIASAKVGGIHANENYPVDFLLDNLKIQNNLIEEAWKNKVKRLLFLGSSCIYPKFANQPIKEEYLMESQLEETNKWYAIAKIAGLRLCEALNKQHGFDTLCLMPTNLYGPGDNYHHKDSHVIPALIRKFYEAKINNLELVKCWGSGTPLREFLHVYDLADACVFALESWNPKGKNSPKFDNGDPLYYLNVGSGSDQTIKSLALNVELN